MSIDISTRAELLELMAGLAPGSGVAEHESRDEASFFRNFLPLPDHGRALDPDIFLILGGRGAGKTELFRVLDYPRGLEALSVGQKVVLPFAPTNTHWVPAFGRTHLEGAAFPTQEALLQQLDVTNSLQLRAFWLGLAVGRLLNRLGGTPLGLEWAAALSSEELAGLRETSRVSRWLPLAVSRLESVNDALDRLDLLLRRTDRWLFLTYDELDRLLPSYSQLSAPIRELLALWLDRWRRWERIRPKIFLRNDLFREEYLAFPDASKLRGHRVELTWQRASLYRLVAKRMLNAGYPLREYVQQFFAPVRLQDTDLLGVLPDNDEAGFRSLVGAMVGKYMGTDKRRGVTYNWIPNHLQDAAGQIAPRSFLNLFSLAAETSRQKPGGLAGTALLQPTDLQGALMDTSDYRIRELQDEYPWIEALRGSLKDLEVPAWMRDFLGALGRTQWNPDDERTLPDTSTRAVFGLLKDIGVVTVRTDGRVNVPDIYLYGFRLKRKGGIKRRQ
jgi:hypothetical protein